MAVKKIFFIYNTVSQSVLDNCVLCAEPIAQKTYVRDWETKLLFHSHYCWKFFAIEYQKLKEQAYGTVKKTVEKPPEDFYR